MAGDKGYSYPRIRRWLRSHRNAAVIPQRSDQLAQHRGRALNFNRITYRQRNAVERCIGWLKACRRLATRYEKLAENFQAMIELAFIQRYLALGFSDQLRQISILSVEAPVPPSVSRHRVFQGTAGGFGGGRTG